MVVRTSARAELLDTAARDLDATLVCIDEAAIRALKIPKGTLTPMQADVPAEAARSLESAIRYLLMVNALNFRFWDLRNGRLERYSYQGLVGALGMRAAFAKAWGPCQSPARFWIGLERHGVAGLFGDLPAREDREAVLNELCRNEALVQSLIHTIADAVRLSGRVDLELARAIVEALPESYGDAYLKKAQLTLAEMASFATQSGLPVSTHDMTLFADYQLPRVLRALGVLNYRESLVCKVEGLRLLDAGSPEERAIRGATILAGEEIAQELGCSAAVLDNFLWCQRASAGQAPFHLTPTRAY